MLKVIRIVIWVFLTLIAWIWVGSLISSPNTVAVIVGIIMGLGWIVLAIKTKCFTKFINYEK